MFCPECRKISSQGVHQFECPLMNVILKSTLTSSMHVALRTFFTGLTVFGTIEKFENFFTENSNSRTVLDLENVDDVRQMLLATHSLVSSDQVKVDDDAFKAIFMSSSFTKAMWESRGSFIASFLRKQTQVGRLNYHEIYNWPLKRGGLPDDDLKEVEGSLAYKRGVTPTGNGSYPFWSLVNHSCTPNVTRIFIDDKMILVVTSSIHKGEQIFDNYGYSFTIVPKDFRQAELLKKYRFVCSCKACTHDWPLLPKLKIQDRAIFNKAKKVCREVGSTGINQKKAFEKFKESSETIERGFNNFPSLEICSLMESAAAYLELALKPTIQFP